MGDNRGTITNAYANLSTRGAAFTGGLVGANGGAISDVYATASVAGSAGTEGALVGANQASGSINDAYFDAKVIGALPGACRNLGTADIVALGGTNPIDASFKLCRLRLHQRLDDRAEQAAYAA